MFRNRKLITALLITLFAVVMGCAQERPPRSYVQPHVLAKADFTGEWYYVPTVVDVGFASTVTFIGETSMDVVIIRWDIQENTLMARLAYDRINGAESTSHENWKGEVVAAWGVQHFDIIREYNATTGEETNIIRETTERPWYEREFMRVDWSQNKSTSWAMFWPHVVKIEPATYFPTDPNDPNYPKYVRNAKNELVYIEVTENVIMAPEMRSLDGWDFMGLTAIPDCFFYGTSTSCNASDILVRHAFRKLDKDNEYAPHVYTQKEHDRFGYFMSNRLTYNRQYGILIQQLKQYANKWNFFQETFVKATSPTEASQYADTIKHKPVNGELFTCPGGSEPCRYRDDNTKIYKMGFRVYNSTDVLPADRDLVHCPGDTDDYGKPRPCFYKDDGMVYIAANSDWLQNADHAEPVQMRYNQRKLRPLVYYANLLTPDSIAHWELDANGNPTGNMTGPMADVIDAWAGAHNLWLDKLGVSRNGSASRPMQAVLLCPYIAKDDNRTWYAYGSDRQVVCEKDIRLGDIRFPQVVWVDAPQQSSPLGYGPPLPDPLTGESISMVANIYGAPLDSYAAYARDVVRLLTDDNFVWDPFLLGDYQAVWAEMHRLGVKGKSVTGGGLKEKQYNWQRTGKVWTQEEIRELFNNMDTSWSHNLAPEAPLVFDKGAEAFKASVDRRLKALAQTGAFGDGTGYYPGYSRLNRLRNTPIEDRLMTRDVLLQSAATLQAAGYDPLNVDAGSLPYGSAIRAKVSPLTTLNLKYARAINDLKYKHFAQRGCVMYTEFVPFEDPASYGVAKEMVDTHCNGTWDDGQGGWDCGQKIYDALRAEVYVGVTIHEMGHNMGLRHNFKGSYDAMNYYDRYWEVREHDGTVGPRTSDPITQYEIENRLEDYAYTSIMDYGAKFNSDFMKLGRYDYAAINYAYAGLRQVFKQVGTDINGLSAVQNFAEWGWPTAMIWTIPPQAVHYTRFRNFADLTESNRDWVPNNWIIYDERNSLRYTDSRLDSNGARMMIPYAFCSDEFRQSQLGCNYFDKGADLYEITEALIEMYEEYYLFNNFSRGRYTWGWDEGAYVGRIAGRYFDVPQNHAQYYALYLGLFQDIYGPILGGDHVVEQLFTDPTNGWGFWTSAVADAFSMYMRVLTMPSPGYYQQVTASTGETYYQLNTDEQRYCSGFGPGSDCEFFVPIIGGKYIDDSWDFDYGYEWYMKITRRGQFYDRPLAIQYLAEATNNFMGRDTQEDKRMYTINFARLFPNQILDYFAGIQTNDLGRIAPVVCEVQNMNINGSNVPVATKVEHPYAAKLGAPRCSTVGGTPLATLYPNNTFTVQLYAAVLGMAMFPMNYSQAFIDKSRIYVKGNGEGIDFSHMDPSMVVEFEDPISHKVFVTLRYEDVNQNGFTYQVSIGARMLDYAQYLLDRFRTAESAYQSTPNTTNYDALQVARRAYVKYIDNLEMVRGLTRMLEWADYTDL